MNLIMDTHIHTIASGHAYSTVQETAAAAHAAGLELICITEHGPDFPGACHSFYFRNLVAIPSTLNGVRVITGMETNILNFDGLVDLAPNLGVKLGFVIASLHGVCIKTGNREENTRAMIGAIKNPVVDAIGHPGEPMFPIDHNAVAAAAKEYGKLLEINNRYSVYSEHPDNQYVKLARACKESGVMMMCGTDSHFSLDVGQFPNARDMIKQVGLPEELIINTSVEKMDNFLKEKAKRIENAFR